MSRVVLAMSGGVDSSVAAYLLREQGHDVVGLFMRHGEPAAVSCAAEKPAGGVLPIVNVPSSVHKQGCCTASDAEDARRVAEKLDIPFYAVDFQEEYTRARTPNPCVMCNNWIKFGKLWEYGQAVGAQYIATGHYAQVKTDERGEVGLYCGLDPSKDQSYVLAGIDRAMLPRLMFPVGHFEKVEIRRIAGELGMRVADKKDSQEICFVSTGDYAEFVRNRRGEVDTSGDIVTTEGRVVGQHAGIEKFTIGQRKGLGIAFGEPRYVVRIEPETRRVVVGTQDELACTSLTADQVNWLIEPPQESFTCEVKIRYLSTPVTATVHPLPQRRIRVEMHAPRHGVAPGQAVVCYQGDRVLGGGWIES